MSLTVSSKSIIFHHPHPLVAEGGTGSQVRPYQMCRAFQALGKPVIGYIREGDLRFIPDKMRQDLPIIQATPANIYEVLKACLIYKRQELAQIGSVSRQYAETWHDPLQIATRLKCDYKMVMSTKAS